MRKGPTIDLFTLPTRGDLSNLLLDCLPGEERERLLAGSQLEQLPARRVLFEPNRPIETVYFPLSGLVSIGTIMRDLEVIEMATIGRDGVVGVPTVLGDGLAANTRGVCQVEGEALSVRADHFRDVLARGGRLPALVHHFVQDLFTIAGQNAACNKLHSTEQRCARWILMTSDRVGADQFNLTHASLAQMMGSQREWVTEAVAGLQDLGAIRYQRGNVTVVNRKALEAGSCECYEIVRNLFPRAELSPEARLIAL
jgi:CRP-like cAMP-binding protein